MALISNPPTQNSIFQFPPNFPNGQVADAWVAWFQEVRANNYVFPAAQTGFALGWDAGGNLVNVPNTGADQTAAWTAADAVVAANAASATALVRSDLAASGLGQGAEMIGYLAPYTGAVARLQSQENSAGFINALSFGVVGDGATDDYAALQAAINAAIVTGKRLIVPAPSVAYKIGSPLIVGKWSGSAWSYSSCTIECEIYAWSYANSAPATGQGVVLIKPTFIDKPAIIIQNGRSTSLKNIYVLGLNTFNIGSGLTAPNYPEMMTNATFVNGGCRDSRYSPYAGIAIDPFGTSVPADGGYPGMSSYYVASAAGSSGLSFENVRCENFVVGCMITPNGTTQNAEDIEFHHCGMQFNKVGLGIGQSQSRGVNWRGGECSFNLYCFDGASYGAQQGFAPNIYGAVMSGKYLFNVPNAYGTQVLTGIYAESFGSIGFLGTDASATNPVAFVGCKFSFGTFGGIFPDWHVSASGPVAFHDCTFTINAAFPAPLRVFNNQYYKYSFFNCTLDYSGTAALAFFFAPSAGTNGLNQSVFDFYDSNFGNDSSSRGSGNGKSRIGRLQRVYSNTTLNGETIIGGTEIIRGDGAANGVRYFTPSFDNVLGLGTLAITLGANGTATFTAADGTVIQTGDIIYNATSTAYENGAGGTTNAGWNALGVVTNVAGNVVTISGVPVSVVAASYALYSAWWPRYHQASTGDTSTSVTIANVTNPSAWKNGQHIRGSGIPNGAYIVSGGGTATLTISKATTSTVVGTRLYDADVYSITGTAV